MTAAPELPVCVVCGRKERDGHDRECPRFSCVCGHLKQSHGYDGENYTTAFEDCSVEGCSCQQYVLPTDEPSSWERAKEASRTGDLSKLRRAAANEPKVTE